jgi:hypothetical protein
LGNREGFEGIVLVGWLFVWAQPIRSSAAALSRREGTPSPPHDLTCLLYRHIYLRRRIARAPPQPRVRRRCGTGRPPSLRSHASLHCSRPSAATAPGGRRQHPLRGGPAWDEMHSRMATPPPSSLLNPVRLPPSSSVQVLLQASYVKSPLILCSSSSCNFVSYVQNVDWYIESLFFCYWD